VAATFRRPPTDHKGPFTQTRRVAALRYEKCKKRFYSARDRGAEYCDDRVCVSLCVYLSVRKRISGNTRPLFTRLFVHITHGRGSVLLWRRCDSLCTSGFMYDVTRG